MSTKARPVRPWKRIEIVVTCKAQLAGGRVVVIGGVPIENTQFDFPNSGDDRV